mgnify:CR=1 FL=1
MGIYSENVDNRFGQNLKKLRTDIINRFGGFSLLFMDPNEWERRYHMKFLGEGNALNYADRGKKLLIIALKNKHYNKLIRNNKAELPPETERLIAHELGHLWMESFGFPRLSSSFKDQREERWYKNCHQPLLTVMEHAIIIQWLHTYYKFNLYEDGDRKLNDFIIKGYKLLPSKIEDPLQEIYLITGYLKYKIEANNCLWLREFENYWSTKAGYKKIHDKAELVLPIIQNLEGQGQNPDPELFKEKFQTVLNTLEIDKQYWP